MFASFIRVLALYGSIRIQKTELYITLGANILSAVHNYFFGLSIHNYFFGLSTKRLKKYCQAQESWLSWALNSRKSRSIITFIKGPGLHSTIFTHITELLGWIHEKCLNCSFPFGFLHLILPIGGCVCMCMCLFDEQ